MRPRTAFGRRRVPYWGVPIESDQLRLLSGPHRPLTISLIAAVALMSYSNLAVSAALPSIGDDLGNVSLVPWVITSELLAAAIAVLGIGPIVDSQGVRRVFRLAMVGFIVFSFVCAISPSMMTLILARVGQGVAAGGVIGSAMSSIGLSYEEALRPRAYATVSAVWGVMGIGGPAVAAALISVFGWRSIFSVSIPVGLIATAIGWNQLPGRRADTEDVAFDRKGLAIVAIVTIGLLMATSTGSVWALVWLLAAVMVGGLYVSHARSAAAPVVRLDHLTARRWRYLHITSTLAVAGGTGASAFLPLYLRGARGASEAQAAFSVLFVVIGWSTAAWVASKAQERMHAAYVVRAGALILAVSSIGVTIITAMMWHVAILLPVFFLVGAGIGTITTAGLAILQGRASTQEMGRVTSAHQFLRSLGFAYGAAVGGAVLFFVISRQISDVEAIRDLLGGEAASLNADAINALQDGYVWALGATALFTLIAGSSAIKLVQSIGLFQNSA